VRASDLEELAYIDSISRSFGNDESMRRSRWSSCPTATDELYDYYLGPKA
jgi:hypothetical protein